VKPEEKALLERCSYYILHNNMSGQPHVDQNGRIYLFENSTEADGFIEGSPKDLSVCLEYGAAKAVHANSFPINCIRLGATVIRIKHSEYESFHDIKLTDADAGKGYRNTHADFVLTRLAQTGKKDYLRELKDLKFLAAVYLGKREEGEYPPLHYAYAKDGKTSEKYLILFTTLNAFELWQEHMRIDVKEKAEYYPVEMTLMEFRNATGETGLLFNPKQNDLYLTKEQAEKVFLPKKT
jgi:hypothetical protein